MEIEDALRRAQEAAAPEVGRGQLATYIPSLANVDPHQFGMAIASVDGEVHVIGDADVPFSVQSISKVFTLALVVAAEGEAIWKRVGREPSGSPFNSLLQLDQEAGRPRNPFINAGALVVTDRLQSLSGDASGTLRDLMRRESGRSSVESDPEVARSELEAGHRTYAVAHLLASYGNLESTVDEVIDQYVAQCALSMSCRELALAGLFLARDGVLSDGSQLLSPRETKRVNAVMLTCGTYDSAGEFAYRVGVPAKSGVGGGILAVIPDRGVACVWSPALGPSGSSAAGLAALDAFTTYSDWTVF
ncbi:glutaminase [Nocardioides glacieisoli]|uniref:Glutaminase n=1 Tax=Nocardioides glacieisoli TaxID=1168730 RepID=A0A4Q2RIX7_9ACTN|nr:glutaminase [Nocardioides glacieisoli]RYB88487.1 glutaminase [Nocardioides glacieisoli]